MGLEILKDIISGVLMLMLIIASIGITTHYVGKEKGYKQGQIDAINGNLKYELITQPDGTTKWEKKGKNTTRQTQSS